MNRVGEHDGVNCSHLDEVGGGGRGLLDMSEIRGLFCTWIIMLRHLIFRGTNMGLQFWKLPI